MKYLSPFLIASFCLIGAHVPKAFSLLYLILFVSWFFIAFVDPRPLAPLPTNRLKFLRIVQALVFLFSLTYPLAMLGFGFWTLSGRSTLDVVSALLLPNGMLWWGVHMARRNFQLFTTCLLAYNFGGLIFLSSALFKTSGLNWYSARLDPGSLFVPWGNEISMNVRSVEQNGLLNVALLPASLILFFQRRFALASILAIPASFGILAVLPLSNGRLWIPSLLLSAWPLLCLIFRLIPTRVLNRAPFFFISFVFLFATFFKGLSSSVIPLSLFCDERLGIYQQSLARWKELITGGRLLNFTVSACGQQPLRLSLNGQPGAAWAMLHSVPLDVVGSVGLLPALPMLLFLLVAAWLYSKFAISWLAPPSFGEHSFYLLVLWSALAVVVIQWLLQPLIYADGLLYFLSYSLLGALFALKSPQVDNFTMFP